MTQYTKKKSESAELRKMELGWHREIFSDAVVCTPSIPSSYALFWVPYSPRKLCDASGDSSSLFSESPQFRVTAPVSCG